MSSFPLSGQAPTQANAQVIIARLLRRAVLQPEQADACLSEAAGIEAMLPFLPEGEKQAPLLLSGRQAPKIVRPRHHYIFLALAGHWPPAGENFKIPHGPGRYYFLTPHSLRDGLSPRRSVEVPKRQVEALAEAGRQAAKQPLLIALRNWLEEEA